MVNFPPKLRLAMPTILMMVGRGAENIIVKTRWSLNRDEITEQEAKEKEDRASAKQVK